MDYTDLHSHIAWDVDDGLQTKDEASQALEIAAKDGITTILSTPHFVPAQTTGSEVKDITNRQRELQKLAEDYGVQIYMGGEVRINDSILQSLREGWLPLIHQGPYMLVEFGLHRDYSQQEYALDYLYELSLRKIKPVIAHVERYFFKKLDWKVLEEWKDFGYVIQVNSTSLLGYDSEASKKNAWNLIKYGYAHVIASDAHRISGARIENLSEAYAAVAKKYGEETARLLFKENPDRILAGQPVIDLPVKKRGFLFGKKR